MKILVTGGSGYLGTHVCRFFNADDFSRRTGHDILDEEDVKMVADYDAVIHLAAHLDKDPQAAELCFRTNAEGALNVVKNLKPNAAFIYASTKDVYGSHANLQPLVPETCSTDYCGQTALEWSKLIGERYVEYFARRNDVRACQAFIDSAHSSGLYNLGGGVQNSTSLRELVDMTGKLIELEPRIVDEGPLPPNVPVRYVSDITKIREQLGWQPQIGIEEGLRSLL